MSDDFEVAIIGAGIGGMCLAHGLRAAGIPVTVHERDRTPNDRLQGYRIRINPEGTGALRACLPEKAWHQFLGCSSELRSGHCFRTERLRRLLVVRHALAEGGAKRFSTSRAGLRQCLASGMEDVTRFGRTFTHYERRGDGKVTAFFEGGATVTADLLVGADGANSRVRGQLLPHAKRAETGMVSIVGRVPLTEPAAASIPDSLLLRPTSILAPRGSGMFIATHDMADEWYLMWAYGAGRVRYPENGDLSGFDGEQLRELVSGNIATWHPALRELVTRTDLSSLTFVPIRTAEPVSPWRTSNVTLLGDAIHNMTPLRGIGANTALRDAALLVDRLAAAQRRETDLMTGLRSYESAMIGYGFDAVRDSREAARRFISENRLERSVFRTVLRAANAVPPLRRKLTAKLT